jgi:uncharacterized protein YndB with AHSA1/START domain
MAAPVARAEMLVRSPVAEVFNAFVDPGTITKFWLESTTGPLVKGARVVWRFMVPGAKETVTVTALDDQQRIAFDWSNGMGVTLTFGKKGDRATSIAVDSVAGYDRDHDRDRQQRCRRSRHRVADPTSRWRWSHSARARCRSGDLHRLDRRVGGVPELASARRQTRRPTRGLNPDTLHGTIIAHQLGIPSTGPHRFKPIKRLVVPMRAAQRRDNDRWPNLTHMQRRRDAED